MPASRCSSPAGNSSIKAFTSLDSKAEDWKRAIEEDGMVWLNASDLVGGKRSPVAQAYGIDGIPAIWLIDPDGRIIAEGLRGENLYERCSELFGK